MNRFIISLVLLVNCAGFAESFCTSENRVPQIPALQQLDQFFYNAHQALLSGDFIPRFPKAEREKFTVQFTHLLERIDHQVPEILSAWPVIGGDTRVKLARVWELLTMKPLAHRIQREITQIYKRILACKLYLAELYKLSPLDQNHTPHDLLDKLIQFMDDLLLALDPAIYSKGSLWDKFRTRTEDLASELSPRSKVALLGSGMVISVIAIGYMKPLVWGTFVERKDMNNRDLRTKLTRAMGVKTEQEAAERYQMLLDTALADFDEKYDPRDDRVYLETMKKLSEYKNKRNTIWMAHKLALVENLRRHFGAREHLVLPVAKKGTKRSISPEVYKTVGRVLDALREEYAWDGSAVLRASVSVSASAA